MRFETPGKAVKMLITLEHISSLTHGNCVQNTVLINGAQAKTNVVPAWYLIQRAATRLKLKIRSRHSSYVDFILKNGPKKFVFGGHYRSHFTAAFFKINFTHSFSSVEF